MDFNDLVKKELYPILQKYGFELVDEYRNTLRYQSVNVDINIGYSKFEMAPGISMNRLGEMPLPLYDSTVKELFQSSLSVERGTPEDFVQNLSILFQTEEGDRILKGDIESFLEITMAKIRKANEELMKSQEHNNRKY